MTKAQAEKAVDRFAKNLEVELYSRYQVCNDASATPSSILLAVANAINYVRTQSARLSHLSRKKGKR